MQEPDVVKSLAALAQPMRLRVFRSLVVAGPSGLTPGALVEQLEIAATNLSFHLKELTTSALVSQERVGRNLVYRAAFDRMNELLEYLTENCCQGEACSPTASACSTSKSKSKSKSKETLRRPASRSRLARMRRCAAHRARRAASRSASR